MGWWSTGVLDGDPPLDAYDRLCDELGLDELSGLGDDAFGFVGIPSDWDTDQAAAVGALEGLGPRVEQLLGEEIAAISSRSPGGDLDDDVNIALQVGAVLLLGAGVAIPQALRRAALSACQLDAWAAQDPDRRFAVDALARTIDAQPTYPVQIKATGLLVAIDARHGRSRHG